MADSQTNSDIDSGLSQDQGGTSLPDAQGVARSVTGKSDGCVADFSRQMDIRNVVLEWETRERKKIEKAGRLRKYMIKRREWAKNH